MKGCTCTCRSPNIQSWFLLFFISRFVLLHPFILAIILESFLVSTAVVLWTSHYFFLSSRPGCVVAQSGDAENADRMYDLIGVVVHCGSGPYRGHYITIVKSHGYWLLYDDDIVEVMCTSTSCCMIHTEKRHTLLLWRSSLVNFIIPCCD